MGELLAVAAEDELGAADAGGGASRAAMRIPGAAFAELFADCVVFCAACEFELGVLAAIPCVAPAFACGRFTRGKGVPPNPGKAPFCTAAGSGN